MSRAPIRGRRTARALIGVAGAGLGVTLGAGASGWLGPLRVRARLALDAAGGTRVDVPPAGHAQLRTHRGPFQVRVTAVDVDPTRAQGLLRMPDDAAESDALRTQLHTVLDVAGRDARRLGRTLAGRAATAGIGGAAALGLYIFLMSTNASTLIRVSYA